jgi:hypothetical protein
MKTRPRSTMVSIGYDHFIVSSADAALLLRIFGEAQRVNTTYADARREMVAYPHENPPEIKIELITVLDAKPAPAPEKEAA